MNTQPNDEPQTLNESPSRELQVTAQHYTERYMTLPQILSCWYQAKQVVRCGGRTVLEIGVGTGQTIFMLQKWGYKVYGVDLDPALDPSVVADLIHLPFSDASVDTVLSAEVLEHLPFEEFVPALRSLGRVTNKHLVITIPYRLVGVSLGVNVPLLSPKFLSFGVPYYVKNVYDGLHYWEMGRRGFSRSLIRQKIREADLTIVREFRLPLNLFSYGFVLRRK